MAIVVTVSGCIGSGGTGSGKVVNETVKVYGNSDYNSRQQ